MSAEEEWTPAFEGQRPPFAEGQDPRRVPQFVVGHELSTQHGAYSPRKVDPLARELVEQILADPALGYLQAVAYRAALWAWARAEAQVQLLTEWVTTAGEETDDGVGDLADERVRTAYLLLHRCEQRAQTGRTRLGLDPLSRARLGKDVAQGRAADAAAIMAQLEANEKTGRTVQPSGGGPDGADCR